MHKDFGVAANGAETSQREAAKAIREAPGVAWVYGEEKFVVIAAVKS